MTVLVHVVLGQLLVVSGPRVYWRGPRAQRLRTPHPALSDGRCGGCLLLFSLSNTNTSYGDRYPKGCTEELNSRSTQIHYQLPGRTFLGAFAGAGPVLAAPRRTKTSCRCAACPAPGGGERRDIVTAVRDGHGRLRWTSERRRQRWPSRLQRYPSRLWWHEASPWGARDAH